MSALSEDAVRDALRQVIDPEVGVNIVDLGLVYRIAVGEGRVAVVMTMTSPACPLSEYLKDDIAKTVRRRVPHVHDVDIDLVWEPAWTPERMSAAARRQLGWPDEPHTAGEPPARG
jgi:metal-sulfur cluster biosynthetic enzyme